MPGSTGSVDGIPSASLLAYQRASDTLEQADPACHLPWPLIAAIGKVESDHGRYGNNTVGPDGVSRPGVYGIALDGASGTPSISDTEGGSLDGDPVHDRAVGPMQFIPASWAVVAVDGDGDGDKNPQDIDDAALATAVYLCAGPEDLATPSGAESAILRYNHSDEYVALVLSIAEDYSNGDYSMVPNGISSPTVVPTTPVAQPPGGNGGGGNGGGGSGGGVTGTGSNGGGTGGGGGGGGGWRRRQRRRR